MGFLFLFLPYHDHGDLRVYHVIATNLGFSLISSRTVVSIDHDEVDFLEARD
jgi:hypothetical protein